MKVALFALNSSYSHTNLAVRAIGASLHAHGTDAVIIEKNRKDARDGVLRTLYEENADVYGFSAYIWNIGDMLRFAAELKRIRPEAKIVFGGPEVSFEDETFFAAHPFVDTIIAGEGEDAFVTLCDALSRGEATEKIIMAEPFAGFAESGIYYDEIGGEPHGLVYYESSRGCPFSCGYCLSSVTHGVRAKTAEKALADLLRFEQFDDIRTVKLVDRTFNFDRERAKTIWRGLMAPCYTKEYHFEVSAALLDEESFALLAQAPKGKFRLEIGVQSTNPKTIAAISRALDMDKTIAALDRLTEAGNLHVHADLIAGLPYEDYASFGRSFDAVYGRCDVLQLGFLKLLRGSSLRRDAERLGIVYSPEPPYAVLATDALPYPDVARLLRIEEVVERCANSGKFRYALPALAKKCGSPFAFFEGLADFIAEKTGGKDLAAVAQTDLFALFYDYVCDRAPALAEEARERLALDFLLGETRRLPMCLRGEAVSEEEKAEALLRVPAASRAGCEVVRLRFLLDAPVVVDRAAHELR